MDGLDAPTEGERGQRGAGGEENAESSVEGGERPGPPHAFGEGPEDARRSEGFLGT